MQLPDDRVAEVAGLVVAERECCPFFTFHLAFVGATVELTADAPAQAQPLVDALFGGAAVPVEEPRNRACQLNGSGAEEVVRAVS